jgi:hypothetical protein
MKQTTFPIHVTPDQAQYIADLMHKDCEKNGLQSAIFAGPVAAQIVAGMKQQQQEQEADNGEDHSDS